MKLRNISKYVFQHNYKGEVITCKPKEEIEVCKEVAEVWLKTKQFEVVGDVIIEKENEELKKKIAELEAKANAQAESKAEKKNDVPDENIEIRDVKEDKSSKTKNKK